MKKTLPGALALLVCLSAVSRADWQLISIPGTPYDVQIVDAGHFAVATSTGIYEMVGATGGRARAIGDSVGAFIDATDCLHGLTRGGFLTSASVCNYGYVAGGSAAYGLRHTRTGAGYATFETTAGEFRYSPNGGRFSNNWGLVSGFSAAQGMSTVPNLAALHAGGVNYGATRAFPNTIYVAANGAVMADGGTLVPIRDPVHSIELFGKDTLEGLITTGAGGMELLDYRADPLAFSPLAVPAGLATVTGVSYAHGTGDIPGQGFGMAVEGAPGNRVLSAVPNPDAGAKAWVQSSLPLPTGYSGSNARVACLDGRYCVVLSTASGTNNGLIYRNSALPEIGPPPPINVDEGASVDAFVDGGDPDGDAVHLSWAPLVAGTPITVTPQAIDGERVKIAAIADSPQFCGPATQSFDFRITASDGMAGHLRTQAAQVVVRHTVPPRPPVVSPTPFSIPAGSAPQSISVSPNPAGCAPSSYSFTSLDNNGVAVTSQPGGGSVTVPTHRCDPTALISRFEARAIDSAGPSGSTAFEVRVQPWGPADAPFPSPRFETLTAGQGQTYFPTATHFCATHPDFPGIRTRWTLDGGIPAGVRFFAGPSPTSGFPVETDAGLRIEAEDCIDATLALFAQNDTNGAGGEGPSGLMTVGVQTVLSPIASSTFSLAHSYAPESGTLSVAPEVSANCPERRDLTAQLSLVRTDGGIVEGPVSAQVPGTRLFVIPEGCNGGAFTLHGELLNAGSGTGKTAQVSVVTPRIAAGLGELPTWSATASCEHGVRGQLTASLAPGSCQTAQLLWEQVAGPPVQLVSEVGSAVSLASAGGSLSDLIGQELTFKVSADAGTLNSAEKLARVRIAADPYFVRVIHSVGTPLASEAQLQTFEVALENVTDCPVSGLEYVERLDGLEVVESSVRVGGLPHHSVLRDGALVFQGLVLPARGRLELTYSARLPLVRTPKPWGQAYLREEPVSEGRGLLPERRSLGCGCASSMGPSQLLGLLWLTALALLSRPRRTA